MNYEKKNYEINVQFDNDSDINKKKYEIFDRILKGENVDIYREFNITYEKFIDRFNQNGEYNIFHYALISFSSGDPYEKLYQEFKNIIKFFNNFTVIQNLLSERDVLGNTPLQYIDQLQDNAWKSNFIQIYSIYFSNEKMQKLRENKK